MTARSDHGWLRPPPVPFGRLTDQGSRVHAFDEDDYPDLDVMVLDLTVEEACVALDDIAPPRAVHRENRNTRIC